MKTIENNHGGGWWDRFLNAWPMCLHRDSIATVFTIARDIEGWYRPEDYSLYYNGYFFIRVTFPFGIFVHVKPVADHRFQCGLGWKLNGRFTITLRWQSDKSAAAGAHPNAPNLGQASAWARGTA